MVSATRVILTLAAAAALAALAACAAPPKQETARDIYNEATELHSRANYEDAHAMFENLISTFPESRYAKQAMIDQIYYYSLRKQYALAASASDRFIEAHPDSPDVAYALYMKGLAYFRDDRGFLDRIGQQDPSKRDPKSMQLSFQTLRELVERFPDSKYAKDSELRLRFLINALANGEIHVAQYYMRRGAALAAISRAKHVLSVYPDSVATEAALMILIRAYDNIGAADAREDARRLLKENYPENPLAIAAEDN